MSGRHDRAPVAAGRVGLISVWLAPFLVALVVVGAQVWTKPLRAPEQDEFRYLATVSALIESGVHADRPARPGESAPPPGRAGAPAYPMMVAALARLDPGLAETIICTSREARRKVGCDGSFASLVAVQTVLAALSALLVFWLARMLSGAALVAWLTMVIALGAGEFGTYARTYLTENLAFLGIYGFLAFAVAGLVAPAGSHKRWPFVIAGVMLALAALSRPAYLYLLAFALVLVPAALLWSRKASSSGALVMTGLLALGFLLTVAPWAVRNFLIFGDPALTKGYAGNILAQRVAYNMMSWPEWAVAFVYWLPDFGDGLAALLFPAELYERLGWQHPENYYLVGSGRLLAEATQAAGGQDRLFGYVLHHYVLADPFKHVMVTLPLSLRGMWAGKYLALLGTALFWPVARDLARHGRLAPFLVALLALLFMVGFHGFVSVNVVRYNVPMIALFAFAVSYALVDVARRLAGAEVGSGGQ